MLILGLTNRSAFDGSTNEGHRKMLNVSIVTVSKVLNKNDPNISEATRQRVLQRAKKLNYRTNLAAKGTNSIRYNADKGLNQQHAEVRRHIAQARRERDDLHCSWRQSAKRRGVGLPPPRTRRQSLAQYFNFSVADCRC